MSLPPDPPDHEEISTPPIAPGDVASAARSCQVIILIGLALVIVACLVVAVAVLR